MRSNGRHLLRSLLKGPQQAECNSPRAHHRFILTVPSPLTSAPFIMHNPTIDDELNRSRCLSSFLPAHRVVNFSPSLGCSFRSMASKAAISEAEFEAQLSRFDLGEIVQHLQSLPPSAPLQYVRIIERKIRTYPDLPPGYLSIFLNEMTKKRISFKNIEK